VIPLGLYVHFPWCVKKCPYCDFNSHPLRDDGGPPQTRYVAALLDDLTAQDDDRRPFATAFLGGGTPSLFGAPAVATLLARLTPRLARDAEITMEANPGATEYDALEGYRASGVNRLSIGAQSFDPDRLRQLGRIHAAEEIGTCVRAARSAGFVNLNLDLMYGLPDQNPAGARAVLERALALEPDHLSWYQLTIEPRTEFAVRRPNLPDEEAVLAMEEAGHALLHDSGFVRYEVSAWARPGRQCRHNLNYWTFGDYLGIGAGAHGKLTGSEGVRRTEKARQPRLYQNAPQATVVRQVAPVELPGEFLMNALRLTDGVPIDCFAERTGLPWSTIASDWTLAAGLGLVVPDRICATALGYRYLDTLVARFV
jgi:oxygen-independent coproporphyrinogen-3 oxidase